MINVTPFMAAESNILKARLQNNNINPEFEKSHHKTKKEYSDVLMQWPIRGMAFTNDIGAAIMDIAPTLGQAFWIPALMYFGADIYDKYRNDEANYDPSARRGFKQAIFQALASVVFPIVVVHAGQKSTSLMHKFSKEGMTLQAKEGVLNHHLQYMSQHKLKNYADTIDDYKTNYHKALENLLNETERSQKTKNPFKILFNFLFGHKHRESLGKETREKLHNFADERIDSIFKMRKALVEGTAKPEGLSQKLFDKYNVLKETFKNDPEQAADYINHAAKDILKQIEKDNIFKTKLVKTIGGFIALGLMIKPMDSFVENVIMHKYVEPGLNKIHASQVQRFQKFN